MKLNILDLPLGYCGYNKTTGEFIITLTQGDMSDAEFKAEQQRVKNMLISQELEVKETGEKGEFQFTVKPNEDNTEKIQNAKSVHAENHASPIAALAKVIFDNSESLMKADNADSWDSESELKQIDTGKKIFVLANLRFEDLPEKLQKRLADPFVRAVHDSMTSLINAGNKWITLQHIAFAMNGYNSRRNATPEFLKQIEEAVEILRHTWVKIDATNEAKGYCKGKGYDFDNLHFDGALIASDGVEVVKINGQRVRAYKILRESILYSYASQKKQVYSVLMHNLALPERLNLTRDNIILQRYLLQHIEGAKKRSLGNIIKYEAIYEILGATEASKVERKRIRDRVKAFLDNWVELAYIAGYHEESKNRTVYSVRIDLFES